MDSRHSSIDLEIISEFILEMNLLSENVNLLRTKSTLNYSSYSCISGILYITMEVRKMAKGIMVKPIIIQWAIQSSGKNVKGLSEKFAKIDQWTSEESALSVSELNKLSKELKIPFGYFFLPEPPIEDIKLLKYRTIDNEENAKPSRELIDTIKYMEKRQSFMRDALIEDGFLPHEFVGSATIKEKPEDVATKILKELQLSENWNQNNSETFRALREASSNLGILVMQNGVVGNNNHRVLDVAEFRAFVLIDDYVPLIFLNARDSINAKVFSLCHELVHIWLGIDELYNDNFAMDRIVNNSKLERFCNEVAAEILLPLNSLQSAFNPEYDVYTNIKNIAKTFHVSELVVCIRLKSKKMIDKKTFDAVYGKLLDEMRESLLDKQQQEKKSGGDYYATSGSRLDARFAATVSRKAREGRILYTEAYELIGAKGKTYDNLIKYVEGR